MVKQVIIARTDLDMPLGRISAQVAHASIAVFLDMGEWNGDNFKLHNVPRDVKHWMQESFVKVVVKAHSEQELNDLEAKAKVYNLPFAMISDDIGQDIHKMALAIGPADGHVIDMITGQLNLL
jgi:PTH2 family peptidyl-tRNA hydrolase